MPREKGQRLVANNKRARYDYFIEETFEAGLVLRGTEVKSLRLGKASLAEAYASVEDGEVWLENAFIPELTEGSWTNHPPRRKRKLLLARNQIAKLAAGAGEIGYTIVPISLYFKDGYAKVEIGIARGKKAPDKREDLKAKDARREVQRALREREK